MYYPKDGAGWLPLRDAMNKLELALAPLIRARLDSETKDGEASDDKDQGIEWEIQKHVWKAGWQTCDNCQMAVLTSQGSIVLLSKLLFTRDRNDSGIGNFLDLDIGQLGSQDWLEWAGLAESRRDDDRLSEEELKRLLHPYYGHHVLIREADFDKHLAKLKAQHAAEQADPSLPKPRGRPPKIREALEVYRRIYPNGREGHTVAEIIEAIAENGGPRLSDSTCKRMLKTLAEGQKDGQN